MPRTGLTSDQLKEKAIEAVIEQMKLVGFERVTLSEIAKSLGVSHAALYSHFADKAALFDAVTERWLTRFDEEQEKLCLENKPGDSLERLTRWFVQLHRMKITKVRHEPELFRAFNYLSEAKKEFVKQHLATMRRQLTTIVSQAVKDKLIEPDSIEEAVTVLFEGTMSFHHPGMVALRVAEDREPLLRKLISTLIDGMRPQANT